MEGHFPHRALVQNDAKALSFPCQGCRALLSLDLQAKECICSYCGRVQFLAGEQLDRARDHVKVLAGFEKKASEAFSEIDYQRRQRLGMLSSILLGVMLNAIVIGPVFGIEQLYKRVLLPAWGEFFAKLFAIPMGVIWYLSAFAAFGYFSLYKKRFPKKLAAQKIGQVTCHGCQALIPVWLGQKIQCPFCQSQLLPGESIVRKAEKAAQEEVANYQDQAMQEKESTNRWYQRQVTQGKKLSRIWIYVTVGGGIFSALGIFLSEKNELKFQNSILGQSCLIVIGMGFSAVIGWVIEKDREKRKEPT